MTGLTEHSHISRRSLLMLGLGAVGLLAACSPSSSAPPATAAPVAKPTSPPAGPAPTQASAAAAPTQASAAGAPTQASAPAGSPGGTVTIPIGADPTLNPWHPNAFVESIFANRVLFGVLARPG